MLLTLSNGENTKIHFTKQNPTNQTWLKMKKQQHKLFAPELNCLTFKNQNKNTLTSLRCLNSVKTEKLAVI